MNNAVYACAQFPSRLAMQLGVQALQLHTFECGEQLGPEPVYLLLVTTKHLVEVTPL